MKAKSDNNSTNDLSEMESGFLKQEYENAWTHLRTLDERRYTILATFTGFIIAIIGGCFAGVYSIEKISEAGKMLIVLLGTSTLSLLAFSCSKMLESERRAAERFRNRINDIRSIFLSGSHNPLVERYLANSPKNGASTKSIEVKDLKALDLFRKEKHCTALFASAFIKFTGLLSLIGFAYALIGSIIALYSNM